MERGCGVLPGLRRGWPEYLGCAKQRHGSWGGIGGRQSRDRFRMPWDRTSEVGNAPPRRRNRETLRTAAAHRCRPLSRRATFRVARLRRCSNPVPVARWKPTLQPAAVGARDAPLFSAYWLEAPGSRRTSRTVVRGAASLALSPRAARGHAHSCRHSTPHPKCVTRLSTDRARPRPPCATRRDTSSTCARHSHESIRFGRTRSFLAYRTVGDLFPGGCSR
jgi:hypothetical protein